MGYDLKHDDGSSLGENYPPVTKSWLPIPGEQKLRWVVGWSDKLKSIVYETSIPGDDRSVGSLAALSRDGVSYKDANFKLYRTSTNTVILLNRLLLTLGHRYVKGSRERSYGGT